VDVVLSDPEWELVHELRLRGLLAADTRYDRLIAIEVVHRRGSMVALSASGRTLHAAWARFEIATAEYEAAARLHAGFEELNRELLTVCSAWQVLPSGAPNEHRDAAYDWSVIDRLARLHERAAPRLRHAARTAARFGPYDPRLHHALRKVDEGSTEWFTSPRIDSYHTVWNQLHEDLLLALGLERGT
jgi:hypothetical protein